MLMQGGEVDAVIFNEGSGLPAAILLHPFRYDFIHKRISKHSTSIVASEVMVSVTNIF